MLNETSQDAPSPSPSRTGAAANVPLPQYGFGPEVSFDSLVQENPFLFRVYTPKPQSVPLPSTDPYFVGQKFNESFTHFAERLPEPHARLSEPIASSSTYDDVAQHMDWTRRHSSPYISTSFSFIWAIWEATRRYKVSVKHDVQIAVIDARQLAGRAVTAVELLRKGTPKERHLDYWKWYRFALESQDVLVYGSIPGTAVLASVPLLSLLDKLPSYFRCPEVGLKGSSLDRISWDAAEKKPSYRQFCQDASDQFLRLSNEHRLRDATGGSVRLAMAFLRPWFHRLLSNDFTSATSKVCSLSFIIAQWPAQWWSRDHLEMWDVIRSLVEAVGEEVREKNKGEVATEVRRLQGMVSDLERLVQDYEAAQGDSTLDDKESTTSTIVTPDETTKPPFDGLTPAPPHSSTPADSSSKDASPDLSLKPTHESKQGWSEPIPRPQSITETATCIITGLLFGAFVTLCIINSQRRTLIYVT